jgi:hypothetical protein
MEKLTAPGVCNFNLDPERLLCPNDESIRLGFRAFGFCLHPTGGEKGIYPALLILETGNPLLHFLRSKGGSRRSNGKGGAAIE